MAVNETARQAASQQGVGSDAPYTVVRKKTAILKVTVHRLVVKHRSIPSGGIDVTLFQRA